VYAVKEIFYSLQGEGHHAGRPAIFCRFSGCNLWSGREAHRASAQCTFCDTDFVGTDGEHGGRYRGAEELADKLESFWPSREEDRRFIVFTGGEPLLQLDEALVDAMHRRGFTVAVETNGSLPLSFSVDWVCVSPKGSVPLEIVRGNELKLVYPQPLAHPERFSDLEFDHFYLQPMDNHAAKANARQAVAWCLAQPKWKLSVQLHKMLGIQ